MPVLAFLRPGIFFTSTINHWNSNKLVCWGIHTPTHPPTHTHTHKHKQPHTHTQRCWCVFTPACTVDICSWAAHDYGRPNQSRRSSKLRLYHRLFVSFYRL